MEEEKLVDIWFVLRIFEY